MSEYPECEKLRAVSEQSQLIGEFIEFCPYELGEWRHVDGFEYKQFLPVRKSINQVLADYFEIDLMKVDDERRAMLAAMRDE